MVCDTTGVSVSEVNTPRPLAEEVALLVSARRRVNDCYHGRVCSPVWGFIGWIRQRHSNSASIEQNGMAGVSQPVQRYHTYSSEANGSGLSENARQLIATFPFLLVRE